MRGSHVGRARCSFLSSQPHTAAKKKEKKEEQEEKKGLIIRCDEQAPAEGPARRGTEGLRVKQTGAVDRILSLQANMSAGSLVLPSGP